MSTQIFCTWCGKPNQPETIAFNQEEQWRCTACLKLNETRWEDRTLQICQACSGGFAVGGHFCPFCGDPSSVSPASHLQNMGLRPSPFQPLWPTKSWWDEDGRGLIAPPCPQCGQPVRAPGSAVHREPGTANPPWNAGWNGRCASCDFAFELRLDQQLHMHASRTVAVRPSQLFVQTFYDEGLQFCGVEIEVTDKPFPGTRVEDCQTAKVFLSMGELRALVQCLQKEQRVWLEQYDWSCDWT